MPDKKPKKPQYLTPAGEAVWPWINKYDDRPIKGKPQKPAYKLNIRYAANNPAWLELKEKLDAIVEASYEEAVENNPKKKKVISRKYPYSAEVDDAGEETGTVILKLKQSAFIKDKKTEEEQLILIPKFDAAGKPMKNSVMVYGGSTVKASFTTRNYLVDSSNEAGISLDLRAVQVLDLVSNQERSASSFGFKQEEGYEGSDDEDDTAEEGSSPAAGDSDATDPTEF